MSKDKIVIPASEVLDFRKKNHIRGEGRVFIEPLTGGQLDREVVEHRRMLLSPWLKDSQLSMIYAEPGIGKTFFALNCAHALISGKDFLKFRANPVPSVLYIDSEMDIGELQERWRTTCKGEIYDGIKFYTPSIFEDKCVPDISSYEGQAFYNEAIERHKPAVIFLDSLSFLTDLDENNAKDWNFVIKWLIQLKNKGISIICIHHTNKGNRQYRGSTKLGGIMNSIIFLERCEDNKLKTARFKVIYDKKRSFFGEDTQDFEAWLDEKGIWHVDDPTFNNRIKVTKSYQIGMSPGEISKECKIPLRTVYHYIDDAKTAGLLSKRPHGNKKF